MLKIIISAIIVLMVSLSNLGFYNGEAKETALSYGNQKQIAQAMTYAMVEHVSDGDTIIVRTKSGEKIKVRLYAIDAPEKAQPYGPQSTGILKNLVLNRYVAIDVINIDRYGRSVAVVYLDREDINALMIKLGAAWHYRYYDKSSKYNYYENLERTARSSRKGLWNKDNPLPPWEYRKLMRERGK